MVVNGHSDIINHLADKGQLGQEDIFRKYHLENFKRGQLAVTVFTLWVEEAYRNKQARLDQLIDSMERELASKEFINHCFSHRDLGKKKDGLDMILAFEGLAHLKDPEDIRAYKEKLGIFYASLSWNEENQFASGIGQQGGLKPAGRDLVKLMEDINIVVDLSHLNDQSFFDLAKIARKPFIASHSNARALVNVERNLTDSMIKLIGESGGIVGLNSYGAFVGGNRDLDSFLDHLEHIEGLIGLDRIVLGLDFCDFLENPIFGNKGRETSIKGFSNEGDLYKLVLKMEERGYGRENIEKILHSNYEDFLRGNFRA